MKAASILLALWAGAAGALTLEMPGNATLAAETIAGTSSLGIATAPFDGAQVPLILPEGEVIRQAWRVEAGGLTTLQMLAPLRAQITEAGWEVLLECRDRACGGFDFRAGVPVIGAPEMHVNFADFRYLSARSADGGSHVSILVSRTARVGFVQVLQVGPEAEGAERGGTALAGSGPSPAALALSETVDLATSLQTRGHFVLSDLTFAPGSSDLGPGPYETLSTLAQFLGENPGLTIALVGHTDSSGSLEANIALSRRRANSVLERLVETYGIPRSQMEAEGMGYLSPIASNQTPEGREANRRVEVIVTSTE